MDTVDSFGYWIRRRRKALDMTQDELAQRVGCAPVSLRKIEADERRPSLQMAQRLATCLALPLEDHARFIAAALRQQATARLPRSGLPHLRPVTGNLPTSLTSLIGRSAEMTLISDRLQNEGARLVTLTGPVGVGKTRLALEVGWRLHTAYRDGVYLVALAPVQDAALVPSATATVLGVRETRDCDPVHALFGFLKARQTLLIFDNFEHLLPAALFLTELLAACPTLHVLVTSRVQLHLYGEHNIVVAPLPLPTPNDPLGAANTAAVRLFCDRAQATRAGFQLTPSLTPIVAEICRRLDGLPLAIELAAARLRLLSPQELHQRLEFRLPLLNQGMAGLPPRRQGLTEAIAWSFGLLSTGERTLLARLAVFVGGFSFTAAEAVCAPANADPAAAASTAAVLTAAEVIGGIQALYDQSLLVRRGTEAAASFTAAGCCGRCPLRTLHETAAAESRFAMLEIIREFALAQLRTSGELGPFQRRHALYFADWAAQAEAALNGPDQAIWLARLEQEADNLRTALAWLLANGLLPAAAGMACALGAFWRRRGHYSEGRHWLEQVLAQMAQTPAPGALRARVLRTVASLAYRQGDWCTAQAWLNESLALYRACADRLGMACVLFDLGWIAVDNTAWGEAAQLNEESLALAREAEDLCAMYQALTNLGWVRMSVGQWKSAAALFEEAYALANRAGHIKGIAVSLANLGWVALHTGDTGRAAALGRDSVRLCHLLGEREVLAECLEILAGAAAGEDDLGRAAELYGMAASLWNALHVTHSPLQISARLHRRVTAAQPTPSNGSVGEAAGQHGCALSLDAVIAYALDCGGAPAHVR